MLTINFNISSPLAVTGTLKPIAPITPIGEFPDTPSTSKKIAEGLRSYPPQAGDMVLPPEPSELLSEAETAKLDLRDKLSAAFAQAGIDASIPLEITVSGDGMVTVGNHPDVLKIENLLENNSALTSDILDTAAKASLASMIKIGDEEKKGEAEQNPYAVPLEVERALEQKQREIAQAFGKISFNNGSVTTAVEDVAASGLTPA